jgi:hypothetical protein
MRVVGYVDASIAGSAALVSLQSNGVAVKATAPDANGQFVLYPVPAGTYDLVVTSSGHATAVITGVPVVLTAYTVVSSSAVAITPPAAASAPRAVTGVVTPATANVRALQTLTGGPTVEVAWAPVDALSGGFAMSLPTPAPVRTVYSANPAALVFAADAGAAGSYTIEAASAGAVKTLPITVNAAVPPVNFSFP